MKKAINTPNNDDMLPEYNFNGKKGVRGKYAKAMQKGYSVRVLNEDGAVTIRHFIPKESAVVLDPDVEIYFPDSESVNSALRSLINLIPQKKVRRAAEKRASYGRK
jgi:hypothetical protein